MPNAASFDSFQIELNRLVESLGRRVTELKQPGYAEAQLRDDFLNPFFRVLGWDMEKRRRRAPNRHKPVGAIQTNLCQHERTSEEIALVEGAV